MRQKTKDLIVEVLESKLPGYHVTLVQAAVGFYRTDASCNECRWEADMKTPEGWHADIWSDFTMTECLKRDFCIMPNEGYSFHQFYAQPMNIDCPDEDCEGKLRVSFSQKTDWYGKIIEYRCPTCKQRFVRQNDGPLRDAI